MGWAVRSIHDANVRFRWPCASVAWPPWPTHRSCVAWPAWPTMPDSDVPVAVLPGQIDQPMVPVLPGQHGRQHVFEEPMIPMQAPDGPFSVVGESMMPMQASDVPLIVLPGQLDQPMVPVLPNQPGQQHVLEEPIMPMQAPDGPFAVLGESMMQFPGFDVPVTMLPGHPGQPRGHVLPDQPSQEHVLGEPMMPMQASDGPFAMCGEPMMQMPCSDVPAPVLPGHLGQPMVPVLPGQPGQHHVVGEPMIPVQAPDQPFAVFGEPRMPMPDSDVPVAVLPGHLSQPMVPVLPGQPGQQHVLGEPMMPVQAPDGPFAVFGEPIMPMPGTDVPAPVLPGHLGQPMVPVLPGQPGQQHVLGEPMSPMQAPDGPFSVLGESMMPMQASDVPLIVLPGQLDQPMVPVLPNQPGQQHVLEEPIMPMQAPDGPFAVLGESMMQFPGFDVPVTMLPGHPGQPRGHVLPDQPSQEHVLGEPMMPMQASDGPFAMCGEPMMQMPCSDVPAPVLPGHLSQPMLPVLPGQPGQQHVVGEPMIPVQAPDQLFAVFGEPMLPMPGSGGPVPVLPGQLDQPMVPVLPGRHGQQHVLEEPMIPMQAPDGPFSVFGEPMMPMPGTDGSAPVLSGHLGQPMVSVLPGQPVQNQVLGANLMVPGPVSNSPLPGLAEPSPVLHGEMRSQPAMLSAMPSTTLPGYLPQTVSPTYGPELLEVHHIFQEPNYVHAANRPGCHCATCRASIGRCPS